MQLYNGNKKNKFTSLTPFDGMRRRERGVNGEIEKRKLCSLTQSHSHTVTQSHAHTVTQSHSHKVTQSHACFATTCFPIFLKWFIKAGLLNVNIPHRNIKWFFCQNPAENKKNVCHPIYLGSLVFVCKTFLEMYFLEYSAKMKLNSAHFNWIAICHAPSIEGLHLRFSSRTEDPLNIAAIKY